MPVKEWNAQKYPGINIDITVQGEKFLKATSDNLTLLASKDRGRELLELLSKRCQGVGRGGVDAVKGQVVIMLAPGTIVDFAKIYDENHGALVFEGTKATPKDVARWDDAKRRIKTVAGVEMKFPGKGTDAIAAYTPGRAAEEEYERQCFVKTPSFVALAHELLHCLHMLSGDIPKGKKAWPNEEARTVGAGKYKDTRLSENTIRKEHGIKERAYYQEEEDCDAKNL